jgi:hypothetical protein
MDFHETSLLATFKNVDAFGIKYATDFTAASMGGQQFALIHAAVPSTSTLAGAQSSGGSATKAGVKSKAVAYTLLHDDLLAITDAAHSLVKLGTAGLDGKFLMPRNHGAQDFLNAARAFQTDAPAFSAAMIGLGLPTTFVTQLGTDITGYENAIAAKGAGQAAQGGATGGIEDATHKAAVALHVLNTIVTNTYKNNPSRLAEWVIASHVEKHTPVPHAKPAAAPAK